MLIQEQLKQDHIFTNNEKIVCTYLLEHMQEIENLSITTISKETYTSASNTVRLAQKLGFSGYSELKKALVEEVRYLNTNFQEIDANIPFNADDTIQSVAYKMAKLMEQTIEDTLSLISHDELMKAIQYLKEADHIYILAITDTASIAYDFKYKMRYLYKEVEIINNPEDFIYIRKIMKPTDCTIFLTYSGETFNLYKSFEYEKFKDVRKIAISSIGHNSINDFCEVHLSISTREKLSNKIGSFVSNQSIYYILNTLCSCLFLQDYNYNLNRKLSFSKELDFERTSSLSIINDKEN